METIEIRGLSVDTLIGVYDWERKRTTRLKMDITLDVDLSRAMASDNVADTVDYAAVAETVRQCGNDSQFELLEALGAHILTVLLTTYPVECVTLTICKPGILPDADSVAVTMKRSRH
ncbi:dihydroneopterin aldolase [Alteromonas sp. CYL-A6]|uniref:dihydroneopterin aldolase n=1 Tax=Alteromonas nitratireducens TaxID=3390813 RepID=UPI0034B831C2